MTRYFTHSLAAVSHQNQKYATAGIDSRFTVRGRGSPDHIPDVALASWAQRST